MTKCSMKFSKEKIRALRRIAKDQNLKGADILDQYTDDEIQQSFNGAGRASDPEWKKWILTKIMDKKLASIMIHDMKYRKGGTDEDFARANNELRDNILSSDGDGNSRWWKFVANKAKELSDKDGKVSWGVV